MPLVLPTELFRSTHPMLENASPFGARTDACVVSYRVSVREGIRVIRYILLDLAIQHLFSILLKKKNYKDEDENFIQVLDLRSV